MASVIVMGVYEEQIPSEFRTIYLYFMMMTLVCAAAMMCVYACSCYRKYREDLSYNQQEEASVLNDDERDFEIIPLENQYW